MQPACCAQSSRLFPSAIHAAHLLAVYEGSEYRVTTCFLVQASCLIVEDRNTAQSVVTFFQKHKVGVVTCKIAAEMRASSGYRCPAAIERPLACDLLVLRLSQAQLMWCCRSKGRTGPQGSEPLLSLVEMAAAAEAASYVVSQMLQNWFLVPNAAGESLSLGI